MKIANEFTVSAPIEDAWKVLTDLEQVIPLMPGAQMTGREGDDVLGKVKVKVGPVTSEFSGKVHFVEQDPVAHRAVIDGKGKEARGTGNAAATVTAQLHDAGDHTRVTVDTDLKVVGKLGAVRQRHASTGVGETARPVRRIARGQARRRHRARRTCAQRSRRRRRSSPRNNQRPSPST